MKAALYARVSTLDQNPDNQLVKLRIILARSTSKYGRVFRRPRRSPTAQFDRGSARHRLRSQSVWCRGTVPIWRLVQEA